MNQFIEYAKHVGLGSFGIKWVQNVIGAKSKKEELKTEEVEHIIDFLSSDAAPKRIGKMSYDQAKKSAEKWMKTQIKKGSAIKELPGDTETILDFGDGFKIVKLIGQNAYKREGFLMRHCVASYYGKQVEVYSLRDSKNMPHCTMEKNKQIKGKGNGDIHPKYVSYIVKFLKKIGMTVSDSEMAHLGYVNVERIDDENAVFADLYDGKYFYKGNKVLDRDGKEYQSMTLWEKFGLFTLDEKLNINFNFDISLSIKTFILNLTAKLRKTETNTGSYSAASNTGDYSAASNTGNCSAASNTGECSAASNTGDCSAAIVISHDSKSEVTGVNSIAVSIGKGCAAKASRGNWIVVAERDSDWNILDVKTAKIDGYILKEDVFYKLENGKFVELN